jgi:hypothetical protein
MDGDGQTVKRAILWIAAAMAAQGHVGSPDVFFEGSAGPYALLVTMRPPAVIPGVAEIEIRSSSADVREIRVAPTPLTGPAADHPPTPDVLQRSKQDPQFFTGSIWIMAPDSWQVRIQVDGSQGEGRLSVPLPAVATATKSMQFAMGAFLFAMMLVLVAGMVSIVGAGAREGQLPPGAQATAASKRRARILMVATAAIIVLTLWGGDRWWSAEASGYAGNLYKPMEMTAAVDEHGKLTLALKNPPWSMQKLLSDFIPDHGHLMHLYVINWPKMDRVWHLHPDMTEPGVFTHDLPPIPAGRYKLYADVVHRIGFPETMTAELTLNHDLAGTPIAGDDAAGARGESPDGARIVWDRPASIQARAAGVFKFRLVDKDGNPVPDMEMYMGMLGHAAFVKDDGSVFAHVHPSGSVAMAALALANPSAGDHGMHDMMSGPPAEADFPYGFPTGGHYHVIVQMKHGGVIETGIFDADVD